MVEGETKDAEHDETKAVTHDVEPQATAKDEPGEKTKKPKSKVMKKIRDLWSTKRGKVIIVASCVAIIVAILCAIPYTRYAIFGSVVKKNVTVIVVDVDSKKPVSNVDVSLGSIHASSGSDGKAVLKSVPVGQYTLKLEKKYFTTKQQSYTVPVLSAPQAITPALKATGRNVELTIVNFATGKPVAGAVVEISSTTAKADDKGIANIMLPMKSTVQSGTIKADGYNNAELKLVVSTSDAQKKSVSLVPSGKIYFLSKRTGVINVMKSNLDGTDQQVVVEGTGQEDDSTTVMLATTDWKYLALYASRDSAIGKLYLINTTSEKMTVMDEGPKATFSLAGWSGHAFAYRVDRGGSAWVDKNQALKVFNADSSKLTTLDQNSAGGSSYYDYLYEDISTPSIVGSKLVYTKNWYYQYASPGDKKSAIMTVDVSGGTPVRAKEFAASDVSSIGAKQYKPDEVYFHVVKRDDSASSYWAYEDGKVSVASDTNDQKYNNGYYPTYLQSPSAKKTLWYEPRDGKNVLFSGDENGGSSHEIGSAEYKPFGWYGDDYIILSKNSSELYLFAPDETIDDTHQPVKITDYHKAQYILYGYGSGYGGSN